MSELLTSLTRPPIEWNELDEPINKQFDDCYLFTEEGRDEAWYNYIDGNRLPERFAALNKGDTFTIAETGFGTGLNFINAWICFEQHAPKGASLQFISSELYPLDADTICRALAPFSECRDYADAIIEQLPPPIPGTYRLHFGDHCLTLLYGDSASVFANFKASHEAISPNCGWHVDAWFLDGFAPARNPEQFDESMLKTIASLSKKGTTLATFSVAGFIKRPLQDLGFSLQKRSGYSLKREMLCATYNGKSPIINNCTTPWFDYVPPKAICAGDHVAIVGAGIAGCLTAHKLAKSGVRVTLIDKHHRIASEGSGNRQGAIYGKLSNTKQALSQLVIQSQVYSTRFYRMLLQEHPNLGGQCGLIQLPALERDAPMQALVAEQLSGCEDFVRAVDQQEASQLSGVDVTSGGLFFSEAWWLAPQQLCAYLIQHDNISVVSDTNIDSITKDAKGWSLNSDARSPIIADQVVITSAKASDALLPQLASALRTVGGQTSTIKSDHLTSLKTIVCAEAYVSPALEGVHTTGASFHPNQTSIAVTPEDHTYNQGQLQTLFSNKIDSEVIDGHAAIRCATRDYLPLAGPVPNMANLERDFDRLRHNKKANIQQVGAIESGLWTICGLGSRGLSYAPLCTELVVSQMLHRPLPVALDLLKALSPARFIIRNVIRANRN